MYKLMTNLVLLKWHIYIGSVSFLCKINLSPSLFFLKTYCLPKTYLLIYIEPT